LDIVCKAYNTSIVPHASAMELLCHRQPIGRGPSLAIRRYTMKAVSFC